MKVNLKYLPSTLTGWYIFTCTAQIWIVRIEIERLSCQTESRKMHKDGWSLDLKYKENSRKMIGLGKVKFSLFILRGSSVILCSISKAVLIWVKFLCRTYLTITIILVSYVSPMCHGCLTLYSRDLSTTSHLLSLYEKSTSGPSICSVGDCARIEDKLIRICLVKYI